MKKYIGTAQGFGGQVSVELDVDNDKVVDVITTGASETPTVGGKALMPLADQIKTAQSAEIDGVTGASHTSKGIKEAAVKAFNKMNGISETPKILKDGEYESIQRGYQGHVGVKVTVKNKKISDIEVTEVTDQPSTITELPVKVLPKRMLDHQSYNVDAITGASLTSNAIKSAVKDALDQAGDSESFSQICVEDQPKQKKDLKTDILVVGGGGAGIMAAIAAYNQDLDNKKSGVNVVVAEKNAFISGATGVSGGMFYDYGGIETGKIDTEAAYNKEKQVQLKYNNNNKINEPLLKKEVSIMAKLAHKLKYNLNAKIKTFPSDTLSAFYKGYYGFVDDNGMLGGANFTCFAQNYLAKTNIDLRLNTRITSLLFNKNDEIIGAVANERGMKYNILAKKVIIASGGFAENPQMIQKYAPDFSASIPFTFVSNTGDGFKMLTDAGAKTIGDSLLGYPGGDSIHGMEEDYSPVFNVGMGSAVHVNIKGQRFNDESISNNIEFANINRQPHHEVWGIIDSNNPDVEVLKNSLSPNVVRAATIEDLADRINVPIVNLVKTIEKYNTDFDNGKDSEFNTPINKMSKVEQGPFYAFHIRPIALSSLVGVDVTENCEVKDNRGKIIKNLYASGDNVLGGNHLSYYVAGHGVGTALYTGYIAGEAAKNAVLNSSDADYDFDIKENSKSDVTTSASQA